MTLSLDVVLVRLAASTRYLAVSNTFVTRHKLWVERSLWDRNHGGNVTYYLSPERFKLKFETVVTCWTSKRKTNERAQEMVRSWQANHTSGLWVVLILLLIQIRCLIVIGSESLNKITSIQHDILYRLDLQFIKYDNNDHWDDALLDLELNYSAGFHGCLHSVEIVNLET